VPTPEAERAEDANPPRRILDGAAQILVDLLGLDLVFGGRLFALLNLLHLGNQPIGVAAHRRALLLGHRHARFVRRRAGSIGDLMAKGRGRRSKRTFV